MSYPPSPPTNREPRTEKPDSHWIRQNTYTMMKKMEEMLPILADIRERLGVIRDKLAPKAKESDDTPF